VKRQTQTHQHFPNSDSRALDVMTTYEQIQNVLKHFGSYYEQIQNVLKHFGNHYYTEVHYVCLAEYNKILHIMSIEKKSLTF
jgi:uncharacterized protein YllA (UPF0747 family)